MNPGVTGFHLTSLAKCATLKRCCCVNLWRAVVQFRFKQFNCVLSLDIYPPGIEHSWHSLLENVPFTEVSSGIFRPATFGYQIPLISSLNLGCINASTGGHWLMGKSNGTACFSVVARSLPDDLTQTQRSKHSVISRIRILKSMVCMGFSRYVLFINGNIGVSENRVYPKYCRFKYGKVMICFQIISIKPMFWKYTRGFSIY